MMSDSLDGFSKGSNRSSRSRSQGKAEEVLDLLSGIFGAGTLGAGLFFAVLFISPQFRLNPLPPTTIADLSHPSTSSPTFAQVLPPTWTPTISPSDTPTMTLVPTDTPTLTPLPTDTPTATSSAASPGSGTAGPVSDDRLLSEEGIADLFTPEIQYWETEILAWGAQYGLDPNLIATVMQIESCGYTRAKSTAGALGLFQVMPQHFKKKEDPYDPDTNAFRGLSWLQRTVKSSDSTSLALAGYNAGIARAKNPYLDWPGETQRYVEWGSTIYQDARVGQDASPALQHWLSKGGSALCNRAAAEQQDK